MTEGPRRTPEPHQRLTINSRKKGDFQEPALKPTHEAHSNPEGEVAPTCSHHWLIESPHGPTSFGRCTECHEVKEFVNSFDDHHTDWNDLT